MAQRYHVKSATLKYGEKNLEMATGPSGKSETREAVEVTSLADTIKQFIPGALTEVDEFTVSVFDKGETMPTTGDTPAPLELKVTISNGSDQKDVTVNYNAAIVTKVAYPNHDATGDRKATVDITFKPDGTTAD